MRMGFEQFNHRGIERSDDAHGVTIKLYSEETNGAISIIEQPFEPGLLLPPHVHQNDVGLYILEGTMHARVGDEVVEATPGCAKARSGSTN